MAMKNLELAGTTIVRTKEDALKALRVLQKYPNRVAAWDTETIGIDPKIESPCGNGQVICASAFLGPDVDFGQGPRLLIDNFADAEGILMLFKEYLEDPNYLKCWHNYGFDRHILFNHGIDCQGFGGDTMHMARLFDPSLMPGEYSLAAQSERLSDEIEEMK
jgi:DNA polymerase I